MAGGLTLAVSSAFRALLEPRLRPDVTVHWLDDLDTACRAIGSADVA